MTPLLKLIGSRPMMWFGGTMGDSCCFTGMIAAASDKKIAGLDSRTWFSMSLVGYLYFIMSILSRLVEITEEK
ncbi:MAG: hypothetical protein SWK76_11385 [Actinomycetota bacterium]|nr:hypothetical protein [Actinomycetota bacterium]